MKKITKKLLSWLLIVIVATTVIFALLIKFNGDISSKTASMLGAKYMSEMMFQMQDHFASIVEMKCEEVEHISQHTNYTSTDDYRQVFRRAAKDMGFEYVALYDDDGNYENLLGESAWYRNLKGFLHKVKSGERAATTGYLTASGGKYLVFAVPAEYDMNNGRKSTVLMAGFAVDKLQNYIHMDHVEHIGTEVNLNIVLTNGSIVLGHENEFTSFFDLVMHYGGFLDTNMDEGIAQIEEAMAGKKEFSNTVSVDGIVEHIYGAPVGMPEDWYFVLSMPQGYTDALLSEQNIVKIWAFMCAAILMFLLFLGIFVLYLRLSIQQLRETEQARMEAEVANKAKSTFLSNMSHDIRTPMNAIAGFANVAIESIEKDKKDMAEEALTKMLRSTDYLRSLLGDVLDVSKIESGMLALMPEQISLTDMVEDVGVIIKGRTDLKTQEFEIETRNILHNCVWCDPTRLKQVLINILGNAVKFTPEHGQIKLELWQDVSLKGDEFVRTHFKISDNGIGMSADFAAHMFDSFSREESKVRKIEGTGLGLSISKSLVDMMEGSLSATTQEGEGSQFYIAIDFAKAYECPIKKTQEHVADVSGMKLLLAEDNDFNYDIAQVLLENHGFTATRAENGQEAVDMYCQNPQAWDMILMDLRMPILDGFQATECIREYERTCGEKRHIPILALSADVLAEDIEHCRQVGMEGHISKPIDMSELLQAIQSHIGE